MSNKHPHDFQPGKFYRYDAFGMKGPKLYKCIVKGPFWRRKKYLQYDHKGVQYETDLMGLDVNSFVEVAPNRATD